LDFTRPIAQVLRGNFLHLFDPPKPQTTTVAVVDLEDPFPGPSEPAGEAGSAPTPSAL
jgi:hypothetical protein